MKDDLLESLKLEGYTDLQERDGILMGIYRFMFTWGLMVGLNEDGYDRRYCYKTKVEVLKALEEWCPLQEPHPSGNWIKCKGYNCGDFMNPNYIPPTIEELVIKH
jgi:hypothetical protein